MSMTPKRCVSSGLHRTPAQQPSCRNECYLQSARIGRSIVCFAQDEQCNRCRHSANIGPSQRVWHCRREHPVPASGDVRVQEARIDARPYWTSWTCGDGLESLAHVPRRVAFVTGGGASGSRMPPANWHVAARPCSFTSRRCDRAVACTVDASTARDMWASRNDAGSTGGPVVAHGSIFDSIGHAALRTAGRTARMRHVRLD